MYKYPIIYIVSGRKRLID